MGTMKLVPLFTLLAILVPLQCHKILVYVPQMGHSHMTFLGHLADTLVRAGNEVVVYTPEYDSSVKTNGTKLARIIRRPNDKKIKLDHHLSNNAWTKNGEDFSEVYYMVNKIATVQRVACQGTLGDEKILAQLRAEKFDLGISEVLSMCGFGIFEKIGLKKYIGAFATNLIPSLTKPFAIDNNPSYVPSSFAKSGDVMSYSERMSNFIGALVTEAVGRLTWDTTVASAFDNYLPEDFDIRDQISKSSFLFVNSDEFVEFPRPITHKVVYVGGIAVDKPKPLTGKLKRVMDAAVNGAVLISFGSIAQSYKMTPEIKNSFVEMMRSFPEIQFIWKYEIDDDVAIGLPNVLKVKWVPQNDLLGHPNTRAFVSHGGMNGVTESVRAGVPLVCIPLFGDQMRNAKMVEKRNVAIYLDKMNLTSQSLYWALQSVLLDSNYLTSSRRLANMIEKKPFSAEERIVKYTDFAVEFGAVDHLNSAARQLNLVQYYLIDIIVPLIVTLFAILYAVVKVIVFVCRIFTGASKSKVE